MRKFSKAIKYSLIISSFMITATSHLQAASCPTLNRDQIRTLCRWDALKNIPLLKIEAKKITIDGATLQNKYDSCREKDSVKQFVMKNVGQTYEGKVSKDFKAPNDHSQVLCLYTIDNEVFGFSAEGVPHPDAGVKKENVQVDLKEKGQPPLQKKHIQGWAYGESATVDKGMKNVEIKQSPQTIEKDKPGLIQPPISDQQTGSNALPGRRMRAIPPQENPPPKPTRELPTQSGGTPPPNYSPPPIPQKAPQRALPPLPNKRQAVQYDMPPLGE